MMLIFYKIGHKIIEVEHIESIEPYDENNPPDVKIIMASGKKHIIPYESYEQRTEPLEDLWKNLSGMQIDQEPVGRSLMDGIGTPPPSYTITKRRKRMQ